MSALVEIIEAGLAVSLQDGGRRGFRSIGVPLSGALDPLMMRAANRLLGNADDDAVMEIRLAGPALKALSGTVRIALAGEIDAQLVNSRGQLLKIQSWQTATLFPGDIVRIGTVGGGTAYVAISGGFRVAPQLGSRSTYLRAGIGGIQGRAPITGDQLACAPLRGDPWLEYRGSEPWTAGDGPIRVIPGPQDEHFTPQAWENFLTRPYRASRDMDRMGIRLEGATLTHNDQGADIISDGVTPGTIQVPANGQPIVLLADCQTTGGYAKIATVIQADLPRLAQLRPGDELHFVTVSHAEARAALNERLHALDLWSGAIESFRPPGVVDETALYGDNLISGAVRGDEPTLWEAIVDHAAPTGDIDV